MTSPLTSAQTRAVARAQAEHITIVARGTVKATGQVFYVVQGTHTQYLVGVFADHLHCTCPAGQHGQCCKHRAAVYLRLASERPAERNAHISARLATMQHQPAQARQREDWRAEDTHGVDFSLEADRAARRETSPVARPAGAFSIWK